MVPKDSLKILPGSFNFTLVTISLVDIMDYTGLIVWHGAMLMEVAHKALSPLASRMVRWRCGILRRFWQAQGMSWPILIDFTTTTNTALLQHFSIADFAKHNTYWPGSGVGFQSYSNQFARFWWY